MYYIPDPIEILEGQIEGQMDLVDENNTYPCCKCGRRFDVFDMHPINAHPASSLECGLIDCTKISEATK